MTLTQENFILGQQQTIQREAENKTVLIDTIRGFDVEIVLWSPVIRLLDSLQAFVDCTAKWSLI